MVLEAALKVCFTQDKALISRVIGQLKKQIIPMPHKTWCPVIKLARRPPWPSARKRSTKPPKLSFHEDRQPQTEGVYRPVRQSGL
jgi:hypothetical protein